ncbi:DUF1904 family protein [uncultured Anaeromusa sp.]|uniref:DUF1904 family protein n=1 Tax=uncultured Anaeromusa sp. TaxID=673273 RepID=UPI0029C6E226|nr:DUF1904 family protein [uncultured Anaeromusa sp.]
MPQLIFKGLPGKDVQAFSTALVDELAQIIDCPRDYFTLEVPASTYYFDGQRTAATPLVQVNWFERGQDVQDRTAEAITRHIRLAGHTQVDVFFIPLQELRYYENGVHF